LKIIVGVRTRANEDEPVRKAISSAWREPEAVGNARLETVALPRISKEKSSAW